MPPVDGDAGLRDRREDIAGADPLLAAYQHKRANLVRFFAGRMGSRARGEDLARDLYLKLSAREEEPDGRAPVAQLYRIANVVAVRALTLRLHSSGGGNLPAEVGFRGVGDVSDSTVQGQAGSR